MPTSEGSANSTMTSAIKNLPSIYFGPYLVTQQVSTLLLPSLQSGAHAANATTGLPPDRSILRPREHQAPPPRPRPGMSAPMHATRGRLDRRRDDGSLPDCAAGGPDGGACIWGEQSEHSDPGRGGCGPERSACAHAYYSAEGEGFGSSRRVGCDL